MKTYRLLIKQEPDTSRMTGFSSDIRLLSKHLVLQLEVCINGEWVRSLSELETFNLICTVSLELLEAGSRIKVDKQGKDKNLALRAENNLLGNCVTHCQHLLDENDHDAMLFVFPDLGIRSTGTYRLICKLVEIDMHKKSTPVLFVAATNPFQVVSPKNYPGPSTPTLLSRKIHDQGIDMRLRYFQ